MFNAILPAKVKAKAILDVFSLRREQSVQFWVIVSVR